MQHRKTKGGPPEGLAQRPMQQDVGSLSLLKLTHRVPTDNVRTHTLAPANHIYAPVTEGRMPEHPPRPPLKARLPRGGG